MEKTLKILMSVIIIGTFLSYNTICIATTESELKSQQSSLNASISETKEELNDIQEEKSETLSEVEELQDKIAKYQDEIEDLETQISDYESKIKEAETQIKNDEVEYEKKQKALDERLVAMYENGEISYLDVLLSSNSLIDFISSYYMVSELTTYDTDMIKQVEEEKQKIETEKTELENSKNALDTAKESKVEKNSSLKSAKSEKETKVAQLSAAEKEKTDEIDELQAHEKQVSAQIEKLKKQYEAEQAAKKKAASSGSSSSGNSSSSESSSNSNSSTSSYGFGWPVKNPSIGTGYGVSGSMWSSGKHTGLDFKASTGTEVYAVGDGVVVDTGYNKSYGNFVEIYHGNNVYSFYAHASSVKISYGQSVTKGQLIMLSGATGNVTGPHLHFEIRTPGKGYSSCVNPRPYLP